MDNKRRASTSRGGGAGADSDNLPAAKRRKLPSVSGIDSVVTYCCCCCCSSSAFLQLVVESKAAEAHARETTKPTTGLGRKRQTPAIHWTSQLREPRLVVHVGGEHNLAQHQAISMIVHPWCLDHASLAPSICRNKRPTLSSRRLSQTTLQC